MVAPKDVVYPRKTDRRVLDNLYACIAQRFQMAFLQWLVVGIVAKTVEHGAHFDPLLYLFA